MGEEGITGDLRETLRRARSGNPDALGRLVSDHQAWLRRLMARLAPMQSDPDDLAQDVFVTALQRLNVFDPEAGDFKAWLIGIARNLAHRAWESSQVRRAHWGPLVERAIQAEEAQDAHPDLEPTVAALKHCVQSLGPDAKHMIELRYRDGLPFERLARSLGWNESSARSALTRIRTALRECLKRKGITALEAAGGGS